MNNQKIQDHLNDKYQLLSKCEDELICFVCEEWCKNPMRIGKCGHYFCSECIPQQNKCCPKCQEIFFQDNIESVHWYDAVRESVQFFKNSLETLYKSIESPLPVENNIEELKVPFRVSFTDSKSFKKNAKGENKLHLACKRKRLEEVKKLIEDKLDINAQDYACWTPLHEAVQVGSIEIVRELLLNGALINSPGEFYVTPLHKAVIMENIDIIKLLVECGADKEAVDFYGRKPVDCTRRKDLSDALCNAKSEHFYKQIIFLNENITAYCHSIDEQYKKKFLNLKGLKIIHGFDIRSPDLTHLIVKKSHKISLKIMLCLVSGKFIVRQEWIEEILSGSTKFLTHAVLENSEELNIGIKKGTFNKLLNRPKLFDGINFYIEGPDNEVNIYNLPITKDFLRLLITAGGGKILKRAPAPRNIPDLKCFPYHATPQSTVFGCNYIIIFNDNHPPKLQYKMRELQHKSYKWLIDSVVNFQLN